MLRRLRRNWLPKLMALLVAAGLWYQLKESGPVVERTLERPLEVTGLGPSEVVVGLPSRVLVRVRGEERVVESLSPEAVVAYLDLSGVGEGEFSREVKVQLPPGVTLAEVVPAKVRARVERLVSRILDLYAYAPRAALVPEPTRVMVKGPASLVRQAAYALATGRGKDLKVTAVAEDGTPLPELEAAPAKVEPRFRGPLLTLKSLPLAVPAPPAGLSLIKAELPKAVRVVGPPELLADLAFVSGEVEWREGSYVAPVRLKLPEGVYALDRPWGRFVVERVE